MEKGSSVWLKIIWVIGFILITYIMKKIGLEIQLHARETFALYPTFLFSFVSFLLLGAYTALLFIRSWEFRINGSLLLCVCLPCLLLSLSTILIPWMSAHNLFPELLNTEFSISFYGLAQSRGFTFVAGLTLVLGFLDSYITRED